MSIQKLDFSKIVKEAVPYTVVLTKVVQKINNPLALAIWVYLSSLPPDWSINKEQIKKHFDIGDNTIKKVFSYLHQSNLIEYIKYKNEKGQIEGWAINVLCGEKFTDIMSTGSKNAPVELSTETTGSKTRRMENQTYGFEALQKKYSKKQIKEKKKYGIAAQIKSKELKSNVENQSTSYRPNGIEKKPLTPFGRSHLDMAKNTIRALRHG